MAEFNWGDFLGSVLPAGASLLASGIQASAASSAADKQQAAYENAIARSNAAYAPYSAAGNYAINKLLSLAQGTGTLATDPGIQYGADQAQKAIQRAAAARGNVGSARTMSELMRSANDYAQTGYGNAYNRLASLAGIGQTATGQNIGTTTPYTAGIGNVQGAAGISGANARTSGYTGVASSIADYLSKGGAKQLYGGASSIYDSLFGGADYGKTLSGETISPGWYSSNYGQYAESPQQQYYDQGESSDTSWMDFWS